MITVKQMEENAMELALATKPQEVTLTDGERAALGVGVLSGVTTVILAFALAGLLPREEAIRLLEEAAAE